MKRCFIFGALPVDALTELPSRGDLIIAADKGYDTATELGLRPDYTVGDFDSRGKAPDAENLRILPVRKDQTDTGYAAELGFSLGYRDFIVYGGAGGLLDHTAANIAIAHDIAARGGNAVFIGGDQSFTVIHNGKKTFADSHKGRISVFALGGTAHGVSLQGLSFPLSDHDLPCTSHLGVSNEFIGEQATVSVRDGFLLIIWDNKGISKNSCSPRVP